MWAVALAKIKLRKMSHCKMIRHCIVVCLCLLSLVVRSHQIHEYMTAYEVQSVFRTDRQSVPEYQVVPVFHSAVNTDEKKLAVHLKAFGNDINLYLNPTDDTLLMESTPVYTVRSNSSYPKGTYYELVSGMPIAERTEIYEDPQNMAALATYQNEEGNIHFNGAYGLNFAIRSMPHRVLKFVNTNRKYQDPELLPRIPQYDKNVKMTDHHIVIKYGPEEDFEELRGAKVQPIQYRENLPDLNLGRFRRSLTSARLPEIIHPELLVFIDYDSFKLHGSDLQQTIIYYAAFFNAVDLKYRALDQPKVHLHIAAIIVALDREATPFLNKKRISDDTLDSTALDEMCMYLYDEPRFSKSFYDVAITITASKLSLVPKGSNQTSSELRGISKYGSACDWDSETRRVESAALVHDAGFDGIATAAHELAHIFGVPHDGSPSLSYIGGPGASKCKWEDGYLMSSSRHNGHALDWSECSQTCFRYFFRKSQAECLYNAPSSDIHLPRLLPGKLLSIDEQCFKAVGGNSCWFDERVCTLLWCRAPNSTDECVGTTPAAEGSECGEEKLSDQTGDPILVFEALFYLSKSAFCNQLFNVSSWAVYEGNKDPQRMIRHPCRIIEKLSHKQCMSDSIRHQPPKKNEYIYTSLE